VEVNSKVPVRDERNKKQESLEVILTLDFLPYAGAPERQKSVRLRERSERRICQDGLSNCRVAQTHAAAERSRHISPVFDFRWFMTIIVVNGAAIQIYDQLCA
jgi:hypothetical protein